MKWTFQQIEGPGSQRKRIELDGWYAPFGRPRRDPVIKEVIKSRIQTTRYPGSSKQTRHAFGTNWEPVELKGRWMTKAGGDTANEMADRWIAFIQDERTCRIAWGFIASWTGYLEELEIARESEHEIAWRLKFEIDSNDQDARLAPSALVNKVSDGSLVEVNKFLASSKLLQAPAVPDVSPDFLDQLDNLAAQLNEPAALMNKLAGRFQDIVTGTYSTIQHFRGALTGMRTALVSARDTVIDADIDAIMVVRTAESDIAWVRYQADFDTQSTFILDQLNKLDRQAELALKPEASKFILCKEGDTWESLSTRATGGPDKAGEIRELAGGRYGERPTPGESYLVL